ncbi:MAG: AMIN domain-containing protein, partial [Gemmatimonadaceae bacterium]
MRQFLAACAALALVPVAGTLQAAGVRIESSAPVNVAPTAPAIKAVSVVSAAGRAEVVIGVDPSVEVDDFALESPYRVVVDLKGATLGLSPRYDRVARGGVTNVRAAMFKPNVVRVVIELDAAHPYELVRKDGEVHVVVAGGTSEFAAWRSSPDAEGQATVAKAPANPASDYAKPAGTKAAPNKPADVREPAPKDDVADSYSSVMPDANITRHSGAADRARADRADAQNSFHLSPATVASDQPRITVTYQDADIRDVIAAFATFSGRTIVVGKDVAGSITAEIKNQPWDVALRAILQGQGLAAAEDAISG